jgi:hypothetical protein
MKCIYVNWSRPFLRKEKLRGHGFKIFKDLENESYFKPDYEILYTMLSVSYWKKYNGTAKLYTDKVGEEYYRKIGILDLWDEIDTKRLEEFDGLGIEGGVFWTSAKSYCIAKEEGPFVFSDLDFIVRQKVPDYFYSTLVSIPHWEIPRGYYYPSENELDSLTHWKPFEGFSQRMLVPNTSFLYVDSKELQGLYWKRHYEIVKTDREVPEWAWLLSDQGVFGQSIRSLGLKTTSLTDKVFLSENEGWGRGGEGWADMWYFPAGADMEKEKIEWEHVWLAKVAYTFDQQFKQNEIKRYIAEIDGVFPELSHKIDQIR